MGIIAWIVIGIVAGILAKLVMPGQDPGGIIITVLIGIAGAFVGSWIVQLLGGAGVMSISLGSILVATFGAVLLLVLYRLVARQAA